MSTINSNVDNIIVCISLFQASVYHNTDLDFDLDLDHHSDHHRDEGSGYDIDDSHLLSSILNLTMMMTEDFCSSPAAVLLVVVFAEDFFA